MGFFYFWGMDTCLGNCVGCLKVNYSLFEDLSEQELELLNEGREKHFFNKGEYVFQEGEEPQGLICLNHGKVKLSRQGKIEDEFIIGFHKPVDFIGFDDLMAERKYTSSAIALEEVSTCLILKENLFKIIENNSKLAFKIINSLSHNAKVYKDRILNLTQNPLESRLVFVLNELADFYGYERDGQTIAVELKRREIAALSNMNTANVIRTLSKFKNDGLIDTTKRKITILNPEKLNTLL